MTSYSSVKCPPRLVFGALSFTAHKLWPSSWASTNTPARRVGPGEGRPEVVAVALRALAERVCMLQDVAQPQTLRAFKLVDSCGGDAKHPYRLSYAVV